MQTFNSIYLGVVVQNNDPERRGRVKVWVPYISTTIYNKWNQLKQDQKFSFPGSPGGENLSAIIEDLKDVLPWAEYSSPIVGGSSTGYYNARFDVNSVSDASLLHGQPGSNYSNTSSATTIDPERKGGKPGALYENSPVGDAFSNTSKINSLYVNPNANSYKPSTYSNAAKGLFSIPNVGAHVWVFFMDGMPHYPVYIGASFGQEDFESIFKTENDIFQDYPDSFENKDKRAQPNPDKDTLTYTNKMVLNQRGAAIEIINSTDRERYKVTHFNGSYYEINNSFTAQFHTNNFQINSLRDKFETTKGHSNIYVGRDSDNIVKGDHWLKVGTFDQGVYEQWTSLMSSLTKQASADPSLLGGLVSSNAAAFADLEKKMGFGGSSYELISKHKLIQVGNTINETPAFYFNPANNTTYNIGITPGGIKTKGLYPKLELINIAEQPGGNFSIIAGNQFTVKSGAAGITLSTTGNTNIASRASTNIQGVTVYVGGENVEIGAANLASITADVVYLKSKGAVNQVMVDSNLGVAGNVVIGGSASVNGELYVNHITAPWEFQATEPTTILAAPGTWSIIGGNVTGIANPASNVSPWNITITNAIVEGGVLVIAAPHSHSFKNVPLTLVNNSVELAMAAKPTTDPADKPVTVTAPNQLFSLPKLSEPLFPPFPAPNGFIKLPGT